MPRRRRSTRLPPNEYDGSSVELAPEQCDVLLLRVMGGLTVAEVAQTMDKSTGAVKALQRRGLAHVERTLAKDGVTL